MYIKTEGILQVAILSTDKYLKEYFLRIKPDQEHSVLFFSTMYGFKSYLKTSTPDVIIVDDRHPGYEEFHKQIRFMKTDTKWFNMAFILLNQKEYSFKEKQKFGQIGYDTSIDISKGISQLLWYLNIHKHIFCQDGLIFPRNPEFMIDLERYRILYPDREQELKRIDYRSLMILHAMAITPEDGCNSYVELYFFRLLYG
ncbi:MAG: hypothetical protein U9Q15_04690, partial [Patescibacteria group bacterium]|nr:hypothetical protein [Patescibacteria group bacterium]